MTAPGTFSGEIRLVDDVPNAFAALVAQLVAELIAKEAPASLALATRTDVDWSEVEVYFGDERFVAVSDPDSNEGIARRVLLDAAAPRAVHSLATAGATVAKAATAYDARVRAATPIGLVHLGLGPDGHTASLFPGSAALQETQRLVVANGDALHPHPRLTFTYPAIARSPLVVFTVVGAEKRDAFTRVRAGDDLPATHVRAADGGRVVWIVDRAAAGD